MRMRIPILLSVAAAFSGPAYGQNPVIFSVDRTNGAPREIVTLHGSDFGDNADNLRVFFGGARAQIRSASNQTLEVRTPTGATFDPIKVVNLNSGRSATAPGQFFLNYQGEAGISTTKFSTQSDFQAESGLYDLCLCDFNDDNKVDVATASSTSNQITVFQNNSAPGNINLTGMGVAVGAHTLHVKCGDLNGDGRPDIVLSEASNGERIFILTNNGSFSFSVQSIALTGAKVKQVGISDLDLDGRPDIVVTNTGDNILTILPNTSIATTLSFGSPVRITIPGALSTDALALGDLDADGYPEIVTSQYQADNENKLYILRNKGSFNFGTVDVIMVNKAVSNIRLADLDADSKPDITIARLTGSDISVYLNNSGSTLAFRDPLSVVTETLPVGMDFSDFDGDGKLDIAVGSIAKSVSVLNNTTSGVGAGSFAPVVKLSTTYINRNLRNADIDGDGKPDIIFTSVDDFSGVPTPSSKISVLRNLSCMVPRITPGGPLEICSGTPLQLKATSGGGITYEWRVEGNGNPLKSGAEDFLDVTTAGSYKVVALSGPSCSRESALVEVTFSAPSPPLSATDPDARSNSPVCNDNFLQLTVNNVGATAYRWRGPGGFSETTTSNTLERNAFTIRHAGLYVVEMIAGTCVAKTDSTLVESITVPEFSISYDGVDAFCANGSKTLTVSPALSSGFSYTWHQAGSGPIDEATSESYIVQNSGEYYAVVTPDQTGCLPKQTASLVLSELAAPTADFEAPASGCIGEEIAFTQQSSGDPGADLVYTWTFGDGGNSGDANPTHSFAQANTFAVTLKVSYPGLEDCSATVDKMIEVFSPIIPEITASATELCEGEEALLSLTAIFDNITWSTDETESEITVTAPGSYYVTTRDVNGCEGEDEITIAPKALPILNVTADRQAIAAGQKVQLEASGADEYVWSPGKSLNDSTIADPQAAPVATTTYVVTGSMTGGCETTATITIQVNGEALSISVPILFSPNGDADNEILVIDGVENYPDCSLTIFDKRGARVYTTTGYQNNWDGTYHGTPLPEGVYYYVFGCNNSKAKTGTVTIIR